MKYYTNAGTCELLGGKQKTYAPRMRSRGQNGQVQEQSGKWTLRYWADGVKGRVRKREIFGKIGEQTRSEAIREARKFLLKHDELAVSPLKRMTLEQFWEEVFLHDYVGSMKASGKKHYKYVWTHASELKGLLIVDVKTEHVQGLCRKKLSAGLSSQTVIHIKNCLSAMFGFAIDREYLAGKNPCEAVKLPKLVKVRETRALSTKEASELLEGLKKFKTPVRLMCLLGITTSMNVSEIIGLKWGKINVSDKAKNIEGVNLPSSALYINEQNYRGTIGTTKESNRVRMVPIGNEAKGELLKWQARQEKLGLVADSLAVFTTRSGKVQSDRNLLDDIKTVGAAIGCPWVNWHSLRHTYNTLGSQTDMSVIDRMAGSGHGNMRMSLLYSHSEIDRRRKGIEEIELSVT